MKFLDELIPYNIRNMLKKGDLRDYFQNEMNRYFFIRYHQERTRSTRCSIFLEVRPTHMTPGRGLHTEDALRILTPLYIYITQTGLTMDSYMDPHGSPTDYSKLH